jgi:tRNA G18 (ribose-2'-O)-methylase SpoU
MTDFIHQRHKPPLDSLGARELVLACPKLRTNVNLARIVRAAGCCGVRRMIVCGKPKIDREIARDALEQIVLEDHRSLAPVLRQLKSDGYALVGLEQARGSQCLYDFAFPLRSVLVIGHERLGITDDVLALLDHVVEIPVYGLPHAYNVATATSMALYEYCRQHGFGG